MHPQVFEIHLDQESKRYIAGQLITGRVILVLSKEKAVKGISVRIVGKGTVSWEAGISSIKYSHNVYTDTEDYIDLKAILFSRDGRVQVFEAGRYEYTFSLLLPSNIPSSFEGEFGSIKYSVEAAIQRSWKDDHITSTTIQVRGMVDLNAEPKAGQPVKIYKEKNVGLLLCNNGALIVNFLLCKAGFVPGEYLQFGVEIRNGATVRISSVVISFRSHVTYKVGNERRSQAEKLLQLVGPSVETKGYLLWQNHFQIPDVPPNPLIGCKIMELKYYLEIKMTLEKWPDLKICTPIVVGSVPYYVPEARTVVRTVKLPAIIEEPQNANSESETHADFTSIPHETAPLLTSAASEQEQQDFTLPCIDLGSSACLAELEKITSRPVQTVPSFLLSASENLYAMSMGSCDRLSTNYEILDDRHIVFQDDEISDACANVLGQLQNLFLRDRDRDRDLSDSDVSE